MRRRTKSRALAVAIIMVLLGAAAVARSAGGYDLSLWRVAGGGATFSMGGKYSLAGTIGQSDAGQIGAEMYTLGGGFWGGGAAIPPKIPGPVFLPFTAHAVAVPLCDQYEPNNNRYENPTPMPSTNVITAKICSNDVEARYPKYNFEDNYSFDTTTANPIQVTLRLPTSLLSHISIGIYAARALASPLPGDGCFIDQFQAVPFTTSCGIPQAGRYIVRLYSADGTVDNVMPYILAVNYQ
jgi:hypothetical protein